MERLWSVVLIVVGAVLILVSAAYGIFIVGIPGSDDAPGISARQDSQGSIAFGVFLLRCLVLLLGAGALVTKLFLGWSRSHRTTTP